MKVVDASVLLYAVNPDTPDHDSAISWLEDALNGSDTVGFTWVVLNAFLRVSTRPRIFPHPMSIKQALEQVDSWLTSPSTLIIHPGRQHLDLVTKALTAAGMRANLVADAHLAAIAATHHGTVVSFDRDFDRFPIVKRIEPGRQRA